ncbi:MAG: mechanosensitive ion channel family protein [Methylocystis sp.]|uniref:mechanosensitive ion channel family protein n=1 Tax=Methylocystis sp. TaxID=1911079 RepID=UPI003DA4B6D1
MTPIPPDDTIRSADNLRDVAHAKSQTVGSIIDTLDSVAFTLGSTRMSLWDAAVGISLILIVILAAWSSSKVCGTLLRRATRLDETQRVLAHKITSMLIWAFAFFVGIDLLGIDLTAFAVFSGAFGLAIGFGLQKTFGNLIAGLILLMDRSIKPGDVISVTDQAGNESFGQIRRIGIRAISVVTRDKTEYLIPNENLMVNQVVNWSYSSRDVRVKVPVSVAYGTDMELAERLMAEAAKDNPRILTQPTPVVLMMGFGDNAINFEIRFWIDDPEDGLGSVRSEVLKRVWKLFKENDVVVPFPQRDINLRRSEQLDRLITAMESSQKTSRKT